MEKDKDTRNAILKEAFWRFRENLIQHHGEIQTIKNRRAKIQAEGNKYNEQIKREYVAENTKKLENDLRNIKQSSVETLSKSREELLEKIQELVFDRPLDLEDTRLKNAIELIQSGVLDYEGAAKLNQAFKGDQIELRILKRAYDKAGIPDGGADQMIMPYTLDDLREKISAGTYEVVWNDLSVNQLGQFVGEIADRLGVNSLNWQITPDPFSESARAAAGLPEAVSEAVSE